MRVQRNSAHWARMCFPLLPLSLPAAVRAASAFSHHDAAVLSTLDCAASAVKGVDHLNTLVAQYRRLVRCSHLVCVCRVPLGQRLVSRRMWVLHRIVVERSWETRSAPLHRSLLACVAAVPLVRPRVHVRAAQIGYHLLAINFGPELIHLPVKAPRNSPERANVLRMARHLAFEAHTCRESRLNRPSRNRKLALL